ncbi:MAG: patatin-like phospholipase family protein, partial [Candidatus Methanoperedens sp.]|nr:patatin-like phospholipase family protein [Candidatus Methanoperedens sp.]
VRITIILNETGSLIVMVNKIAIACQGGGSHTAFTAGVLKRILKENKKKYDIIALSGTSGGAICALLTWYGLLTGGSDKAIKMLESFWKDVSANTLGDMLMNEWIVETSYIQDKILIPQISPYDFPPFYQQYLRSLIEKQVDFEKVSQFKNPKPELIIGAVDVLSGNFSVFKNSRINSDVVVASAAIPTFFRAVPVDTYLFSWDEIPGNDSERLIEFLKQNYSIDWIKTAKIEKIDDNKTIRASVEGNYLSLSLNNEKNKVNLIIDDGRTDEFIVDREDGMSNIIKKSQYWDGLFSQNPPLRDFVDGVEIKPEEIWVIQINPREISKIPDSVGAIRDRRNELAGNLSLYQELYFIEKVNEWIEKGLLEKRKYKYIKVKFIKMLRELDVETKLDRNPKFIEDMMSYGEEQAGKFIKQLPSEPIKKEPFSNVIYK